jgi:hypothetical protein
MSLAKRLMSAQANVSNKGCQTCKWWSTQTSETKSLINAWLDGGSSSMQLHEILSSSTDDSVDPSELLNVSYSAWQNHIKHHDEMCREPS